MSPATQKISNNPPPIQFHPDYDALMKERNDKREAQPNIKSRVTAATQRHIHSEKTPNPLILNVTSLGGKPIISSDPKGTKGTYKAIPPGLHLVDPNQSKKSEKPQSESQKIPGCILTENRKAYKEQQIAWAQNKFGYMNFRTLVPKDKRNDPIYIETCAELSEELSEGMTLSMPDTPRVEEGALRKFRWDLSEAQKEYHRWDNVNPEAFREKLAKVTCRKALCLDLSHIRA